MSWAAGHGRSPTATLCPAPAAAGATAGAAVPASAVLARIGAATAAPATAAPRPTTCRRDRLSAMFVLLVAGTAHPPAGVGTGRPRTANNGYFRCVDVPDRH